MAIIIGFKFDVYSDPMNLSVMGLTLLLYGYEFFVNMAIQEKMIVLTYCSCTVQFYIFYYIEFSNIFLLSIYSFACVPLLYPFSYLFEVPSTAFVVLSSGNLFIGTITLVMTIIFEGFDEEPVCG